MERTVSAKVVDVFEEFDKRVLQGVGRIFMVPEHASKVTVQRGLPRLNDIAEGSLTRVWVSQGLCELTVG
jgi:hypothetical protein